MNIKNYKILFFLISVLTFHHLLVAKPVFRKKVSFNKKYSLSSTYFSKKNHHYLKLFQKLEKFSDFHLNMFFSNEKKQFENEKITIHKEKINLFFNKILPPNKFNGSIIVAKEGNILFERYSGFTDVANKKPVDTFSNFHIASVSKTFTAMVILKLEEQKVLSINDNVQKYLPEFIYSDITIKDLLSHRSGLNTYNNFMDNYWIDKKSFANNYDVLINLNEEPKTKIFGTGKRFFYSNSNYALLALIIERVTKMNFSEYMKKYFFEPLGMKNTFVFQMKDTAKCTASYDEKNHKESYLYLDLIIGDKGVYTTARDLLRWDLALYNPRYFSKEILQKAYQSHSVERKGSDHYGLGWRIRYFPDSDKFIVYHYGWWHGNRSIFIRDIEDKTTIILVSNKLNKNMYKSIDLVSMLSNKNF